MSCTYKVLTVASLLTGSLLSPSFARAQQDGFDKPLGQGDRNRAQGQSVTRSVMTHNDNGNSITVEMENGRVSSVEHNGKQIPKDRYRIENGLLTVLDGDGKAVHEMRLPQMAMSAPGAPAAPVMPNMPFLGEIFRQGPRVMISPDWQRGPMPRVRMGIMMAADNDANAVIVESVSEGSPAEKAGLRAGDVIERVDGKAVRTQQELRETLATKNPGDKVVLRIERDRDEQEITVELAKAEDVGGGMTALPMRSMIMLDAGELEKLYGNAESELSKALEDLNKGNSMEAAKKALESALESLRASRDEMKKLRDTTASNGLDLGNFEGWGERFGQQMGGWGENFGQRMQEWGEQMQQWAEQMEREAGRGGNGGGGAQQAPREFRRELRRMQPAPEANAEAQELREMLRAMQERLDRLEQGKPAGQEKAPE